MDRAGSDRGVYYKGVPDSYEGVPDSYAGVWKGLYKQKTWLSRS